VSFHEQVHVTEHDPQHHNPRPLPGGFHADRLLTAGSGAAVQEPVAAFRAAHHVIPEIVDATRGNLHLPGHAGDDTHRLCQITRFPRRLKTAVPSGGV
jgi:hypothetical protein